MAGPYEGQYLNERSGEEGEDEETVKLPGTTGVGRF